MAKLLLINPSYLRTYGSNQGGIANPVYPILSLAALAGEARQAGHDCEILDLSYRTYDPQKLAEEICRSRPDVVGVTATTPLVNQLRDISFLVKDISDSTMTVGGGAHPSSRPRDTMEETALDGVVKGEGDKTIVRYWMNDRSPKSRACTGAMDTRSSPILHVGLSQTSTTWPCLPGICTRSTSTGVESPR